MTFCVLEALPKALEMSSCHSEALSGLLGGLPVVIEGLSSQVSLWMENVGKPRTRR